MFEWLFQKNQENKKRYEIDDKLDDLNDDLYDAEIIRDETMTFRYDELMAAAKAFKGGMPLESNQAVLKLLSKDGSTDEAIKDEVLEKLFENTPGNEICVSLNELILIANNYGDRISVGADLQMTIVDKPILSEKFTYTKRKIVRGIDTDKFKSLQDFEEDEFIPTKKQWTAYEESEIAKYKDEFNDSPVFLINEFFSEETADWSICETPLLTKFKIIGETIKKVTLLGYFIENRDGLPIEAILWEDKLKIEMEKNPKFADEIKKLNAYNAKEAADKAKLKRVDGLNDDDETHTSVDDDECEPSKPPESSGQNKRICFVDLKSYVEESLDETFLFLEEFLTETIRKNNFYIYSIATKDFIVFDKKDFVSNFLTCASNIEIENFIYSDLDVKEIIESFQKSFKLFFGPNASVLDGYMDSGLGITFAKAIGINKEGQAELSAIRLNLTACTFHNQHEKERILPLFDKILENAENQRIVAYGTKQTERYRS